MAKRWTPEEDALILQLRDQGYTAREIALRLVGRTYSATRTRLAAISDDNLRKRWTKEEIDLAFKLKEEGRSNKYIAKQLNRTVSAVSGFFTRTASSYYTSLESESSK
jgi:transcriptional regulator